MPRNKQEGLRCRELRSREFRGLELHELYDSEAPGGTECDGGCWTRHTAGSYGPILSVFGGATGGWYLDTRNADATHTSVAFGVDRRAAAATVQATTAAGTLPLNTWTQVIGRFDAAAGQGQIFLNGQASGAAASQSGFGTAPNSFTLSAAFGGYAWMGSSTSAS